MLNTPDYILNYFFHFDPVIFCLFTQIFGKYMLRNDPLCEDTN
jgi:hypothetical protein